MTKGDRLLIRAVFVVIVQALIRLADYMTNSVLVGEIERDFRDVLKLMDESGDWGKP